MPNYAYKCDKGHEFDELQTIHEEPLKTCPMSVGPPGQIMSDNSRACAEPVHRVISRVSFSFKGGAPTKKFYTRG